jgi:hypothetical protein
VTTTKSKDEYFAIADIILRLPSSSAVEEIDDRWRFPPDLAGSIILAIGALENERRINVR